MILCKLVEEIKSKPNFYAEKGASALQIEQAELSLGLDFALDFKECLCEFGAISVDGHELTGFSADKNLDVVQVTQNNRKKHNVGNNLYVIEETHIDGIVIWQSSSGEIYQTTPEKQAIRICNSLKEYIEMT